MILHRECNQVKMKETTIVTKCKLQKSESEGRLMKCNELTHKGVENDKKTLDKITLQTKGLWRNTIKAMKIRKNRNTLVYKYSSTVAVLSPLPGCVVWACLVPQKFT